MNLPRHIVSRAVLGMLSAALLSATALPAAAAGAFDEQLAFDAEDYTSLSVNLDGVPISVRRYEFVYVGNPVEMAAIQPPKGVGPNGEPPGEGTPLADPFAFHKMVVFVPETAYENTETAIILQVRNSGWFASGPSESVEDGGAYVSDSDTDMVGEALKAGYVIASAGTRSRSALAADDSWAGKAPAVVVDAKAAVRYLRLNDAVMPGSAERIVITGTSGGGGLSVAVAASGNSPDYFPYLATIGAAGMGADGASSLRDDVFATIAYCPITDLPNADIAYEWQFNAVRTAGNTVGNDYAAAQAPVSRELADRYATYLAGLGITLEDGTPLTAESMDDAIVAAVTREAEEVLAEGGAVPALGEIFTIETRNGPVALVNDWLETADGKVVGVDYENYLAFVSAITPLKVVPAFDATANSAREGLRGESSLFGGTDVPYANFTEYSWNNNDVAGDGSGLDDTGANWMAHLAADPEAAAQLKLVSPMPYFGTGADAAPYWYIRHGMIDRDTAFAVELALYHAARNDPSIEDVSFELAWLRPHSGNYDVQEAYAWLAEKLAAAGAP